jgi:hypothetical protein
VDVTPRGICQKNQHGHNKKAQILDINTNLKGIVVATTKALLWEFINAFA